MQAGLGETGVPIIGSGPTHVAVDNLAARLHQVTTNVVEQANVGKQPDDPSRFRRCFVVRAYRLNHEIIALKTLLRDGPNATGKAAVNKGWKGGSKWKPHLSIAAWFVVLVGNGKHMATTLHADDKPALFELRAKLAADSRLDTIRARVTGRIQSGYNGPNIKDGDLEEIFAKILAIADILCTTPAASENVKEFRRWRDEKARGVVLDEAACMHRHDALQVWGNTMMTLIIGGDHKQLRPIVLTGREQDAAKNFLHHLVHDGKISFMEFLQGIGFPVHRLQVQLRMGHGLFDMMATVIYPEVGLKYGERCDITTPAFEVGRALEAFIQETYPAVRPPPGNWKLSPVFLHNSGIVHTDKVTGSKRAPDQVTAALAFIEAFTSTKKVDPKRIFILSPYAGNLPLIQRMLKKNPKYSSSLNSLPEPMTVDSFQGQEHDIVVVIMGTNSKTGPGFTADPHRMNVMLTRHKCGLVVVGDIEAINPQKGKGKGKGKVDPNKMQTETVTGEVAYINVSAVRSIYGHFKDTGRVIGL